MEPNRPDWMIRQKEYLLSQIEEHKLEIAALEHQIELIDKELGVEE
jgi:hypothetical protein